MSEIHVEEHSSPIKTPRQLLVIIVLAFAVPVGLISMLASLLTSGGDYSKNNPAMSDEAIAKRLQPVGTVVVSAPGGTGGTGQVSLNLYVAAAGTGCTSNSMSVVTTLDPP